MNKREEPQMISDPRQPKGIVKPRGSIWEARATGTVWVSQGGGVWSKIEIGPPRRRKKPDEAAE